MRMRGRMIGLGAAAVTAALAIGACGSSGGSGGSGGGGSGPSVNVVEAAATPGRIPFYIALYGGFFKKQGLNVHLVEAQSGSQGAQLLAGGKVQFELGQLSDALNTILAKQPVSAIALLYSKYANALIVGSKYADKVKNFSGLSGVPIGITGVGSGTWQLARMAAHLGGVSDSDMHLVNIGGAAIASGQSLIAGRVGAQVSNDPTDLKLTNSGKAAFLADPMDMSQGVGKQYAQFAKLATEPYIYNTIYGTKSYISSHADVTQKLVNGMQQAANFIQQQPPSKTAALLMNNPQLKPFGQQLLTETIKRARDTSHSLPASLVIPQVAYTNTVQFAKELNSKYTSIPFSTAVDNSFATKAASTVGAQNAAGGS